MLTRLSIHHLRNLQAVTIAPTSCNLIVGANGSGKTSLLESIYLLSRGKSFRHHQPRRYITHHQPHLTIRAEFANGETMAMQKTCDAFTTLRLNEQPVYSQSQLTHRLPTLLIDPSSMDLLEQGSASRRQLIDWAAFHVKPTFHPEWLAYQRLLKQRNSLLATKSDATWRQQQLSAWDISLSAHADLITEQRRQIVCAFAPLFEDFLQQLLPQHAEQIQLRFTAGYDETKPLSVSLAERVTQHEQLGHTPIGCHRADLHLEWRSTAVTTEVNKATEASSVNDAVAKEDNKQAVHVQQKTRPNAVIKEQAAHVLSRGEKKLLIIALRLAQLALLSTWAQASVNGSRINAQPITSPRLTLPAHQSGQVLPIVMIDDISAELDKHAQHVLLKTLAGLPCQLFLTSLDEEVAGQMAQLWTPLQVFHVKQGAVHSV